MIEIEKYLRKIKKPVTMEKLIEKVTEEKTYDVEAVKEIIKDKINKYELIETPNNKYIPISKTSFRVGKYCSNERGQDFIISGENKYPISFENSRKIVDGDIVLVDIFPISKTKSCTVEKLLERNIDNILGEVVKINSTYYVVPEDKQKQKITIALEGEDFIEGEKVIVNCNEKRNDNFYIGQIIKEIGHKDDPGMDIVIEAYKYDIDNEITEEELNELDTIPTKVLESDKIGRMDFTDKEIFTIDQEDTKDLDDAVSLEILDNGNYLLGVYIADVSEYIKEGSLLDLRARRKGTSSYLINNVIPMLPHKISNGICSLNPGVERLSLCCRMELNKKGNIVSYNIDQAVIKSNIKMSYEKVNKIFNENNISEGYESHVETLKNMQQLAQILFDKRQKRGAIEFNKPELKLIVDDNNKVIDFEKKHQDKAEKIIEEFMLVTNETIAKDMFQNDYPLIYRNHEEPKEEKILEYLEMLKSLGYSTDYKIDDIKLGQELASSIKEDDSLSNMMKIKLLKTFRRAFYSDIDLGHYGLASSYYCHFTSPIRRYPDTTNHRLIKEFHFSEEDKELLKKKWKNQLPEIAKISSERERAADECERMVEIMKSAEYMENHIGDEFIGTIIDMDSNEMKIELDNMVEGTVHQKNLKGKYVYYKETLSYISLDNQEDYYLGDKVNLRVVSANKEKKTINFEIIKKLEENKLINKNQNNNNRVLIKKKRADDYYYNVNKGIKK